MADAITKGEACAYCGDAFDMTVPGKRKTRDHVIPKSIGGGRSVLNIVFACADCNSLKANHTPTSLRGLANDVHAFAIRCRVMADHVERIMQTRGMTIGGGND